MKTTMKIFHALLLACFLLALPGCSSNETSIATEGATAEDFAKYEADLAKANGEANYEEESDDE